MKCALAKAARNTNGAVDVRERNLLKVRVLISTV
jgi:hypothetical protein